MQHLDVNNLIFNNVYMYYKNLHFSFYKKYLKLSFIKNLHLSFYKNIIY